MKKANWTVGEKVRVPYYCFAPMRRGWNGWLFADGEIIEKRERVKDGAPMALVEYTVDGETHQKQYLMEHVFKR